jgi:hypothetical protein
MVAAEPVGDTVTLGVGELACLAGVQPAATRRQTLMPARSLVPAFTLV